MTINGFTVNSIGATIHGILNADGSYTLVTKASRKGSAPKISRLTAQQGEAFRKKYDIYERYKNLEECDFSCLPGSMRNLTSITCNSNPFVLDLETTQALANSDDKALEEINEKMDIFS